MGVQAISGWLHGQFILLRIIFLILLLIRGFLAGLATGSGTLPGLA